MASPIRLKRLRRFTMTMVTETSGTSLMLVISTMDMIRMSSYMPCLTMTIC
nr:MAG TPA: hypothetical protein [Caudoviricetes sp.]